MSKLQLNAIATRMLTDDDFQSALLDQSRRRETLVPFKLTDAELSAVMEIKAESPRLFLGSLRNVLDRLYPSNPEGGQFIGKK